ncbi:MAG: tetratricopeptide repeat protein [Aphanocapsa sp. GSE-SYN-MK-11-07L]|jgi:tetratricopeptide (TPR) repeat protein|nr:tetratricopeptide repeat protein [Aphanocapsa sp. GSE-SYN-MK-11-07L]
MDQTPPPSIAQIYAQRIEEIVQATLKGQIRAKSQVGQMLLESIQPGTGEIFERCLSERLQASQTQIEALTDELKLAKANRSLRALQAIQAEWERLQTELRSQETVTSAVQAIGQANLNQRFSAFVQLFDPNLPQSLNQAQLKQIAKAVEQQADSADPEAAEELLAVTKGIQLGLVDWQQVEKHLVSWIYERPDQVGFSSGTREVGPWELWSKHVQGGLVRSLFQALAQGDSPVELVSQQPQLVLAEWVELVVVVQYLHRGLVAWSEKMIYDGKLGAKLSITGFLVFAVFWSQLANGSQQNVHWQSSRRDRLAETCFQIMLQILRTFTQRSYFPLYGGMYASFGGKYLREAITYLDQPLQQIQGQPDQAKARILTLLGYSLRAQGRYDAAVEFHQAALEIAQTEGDRPCEIASYNHLSRICVARQTYAEAIDYSQRALMLSRQTGELLGEANALANLGFSEVFLAKTTQAEPEAYERAIELLERGKQLSEQLGDRQSQALCLSSLGIAHVVVEQFEQAIPHLGNGWQAAQMSGDLYLQGLNLYYLAQAYYPLQRWEQAVFTGCVGMYLLEQVGAQEWQQAAGLMAIGRGQIGAEAFQAHLNKSRPSILEIIGVDGYDHISYLLQTYQAGLD